jgi:hypothetical protein
LQALIASKLPVSNRVEGIHEFIFFTVEEYKRLRFYCNLIMTSAKSPKSLNQPERKKIISPFGFAYRPNRYFKFLFLFQKNSVFSYAFKEAIKQKQL